MGKRRGEDAGIDMQVQKEAYDAGSISSTPPSSTSSGGPLSSLSSAGGDRKIVRGARKLVPKGTKKVSVAPSNPFAQVNLLGPSSSTANAASSSSSSSLFGTLSKEPLSSVAGSSSGLSSAPPLSSMTSSSIFSSPFTGSSKTSSSLFSSSSFPSSSNREEKESKPSTSSLFSSSLSEPSPLSTLSSAKSGGDQQEDDLKNIAALNSSFCKWVSSQMKKDDSEPLINGVRNYIQYAKKLSAKVGVNSLSNGSKLGATSAIGSSLPASGTSGSFPGLFSGASSLGSSSNGGAPTSSTSSTSLFSGLQSSSSSFSFGASSSSPFSFGSAAASSANNNDGDEDGDAMPPEPKTEVADSLQEDEELVHKVRAKVMAFRQKEEDAKAEWGSKGVGDLSILREKGSGRAFIILRSDTGRVTCNIPVSSSINATVDDKSKSVRFVAVSYGEDKEGNPEAENGGKPSPFMIRVKDAAQAQELCSKINSSAS